ncbi:MAG: aminotransferase class IV [Planctomycetota bacterium]|jgi:branched-chain amino acid aminotransferase
MVNLCNLNGEILPESEARIPVLDRGFLFGDSVYEVMRVVDGIPFGWIEHLERLHQSAEGLGLAMGIDDRTLMARVMATLEPAGDESCYVRVILTRGTGTAPNVDLAYAPGPSTCVILVRDLHRRPEGSARLAIVPRLRMNRRALDPAIKSGNYLNNVLGLKEARERGATDCLFLNAEGRVTEASTSNFYLVKADKLFTPGLSAGLLAGITRGLLLQLCAEHDIPCLEQDLTEADTVPTRCSCPRPSGTSHR